MHGQDTSTQHDAGLRPLSPWARDEAHLVTARVGDLLDEASGRLARLISETDLGAESTAQLLDALHQLDASRSTVHAVRRNLRASRDPSRTLDPGGA